MNRSLKSFLAGLAVLLLALFAFGCARGGTDTNGGGSENGGVEGNGGATSDDLDSLLEDIEQNQENMDYLDEQSEDVEEL